MQDRTSWREFPLEVVEPQVERCGSQAGTLQGKHTFPVPTANCGQTYIIQTMQEGGKKKQKITQKLSPFDLSLSLSLCVLEAVPLQSDRCLFFLTPTSPRLSVPRRICSCSGLPFCACVLDLPIFVFFSPFILFLSLSKAEKKHPSLPPLLRTPPAPPPSDSHPTFGHLSAKQAAHPPHTLAGTLSWSIQSLPRRR